MKLKALFKRAFQVALSSATNVVARNQTQPVRVYALYGAQQRFSGCARSKKILSFYSEFAGGSFMKMSMPHKDHNQNEIQTKSSDKNTE